MIAGTAPSSAQARVIAPPMPLAPPVITTILSLSCKSIEAGGVSSEDLVFVTRGESFGVIVDDLLYLRIAAAQQADRPVGAKHETIDAKRFEDNIEIWPKILRLPMLPIGFRHHARQFAPDVRMLGYSANATSPSVSFSSFDLRLCNVIDYEFLFRELLHEFICDRQMASIDKNVIGEPKARKMTDAAQEILA